MVLPVFKQIYEFIFPKKEFDYKVGEVAFFFPSSKASRKTKAILKIYGKSGFIVCKVATYGIERNKPSVKLLSRQMVLKYSRPKEKNNKKIWAGWIPLDEIDWIKKDKYKLWD